MTHSMFCDNSQKRSGECDDLDHVPSAKRMKTKSSADSGAMCVNYQNTVPYSDNPAFLASQKRNIFQPSAHQSLPEFQNDGYVAQNNEVCLPPEECSIPHSDLKYLPDLSAVENPHYYENNKLLFELYVERIQRATTPHSVNSSQQQSF